MPTTTAPKTTAPKTTAPKTAKQAAPATPAAVAAALDTLAPVGIAAPWGPLGPLVYASQADAQRVAALAIREIPSLGGRSERSVMTPKGKRSPDWPRLAGPGVVQKATRLALCHARHGMTADALPVYGTLPPSPSGLVIGKLDKDGAPLSPDGTSPVGWLARATVSAIASNVVETGVGVRVKGKTWSDVVKSLSTWCDDHADVGDDGAAVAGWAADAMTEADALSLTSGGLARVKAMAKEGRAVERIATLTARTSILGRTRANARTDARDARNAERGNAADGKRAAKGAPRLV